MSHAHRQLAAVLVIGLTLSGCSSSSRPVSTPGVASADYGLAIERGRNIMRPLVRRGSGVAVAVGVDGELVWSEGFGRSLLDGGRPVQPDSPFRIYSLMKQVTAALALEAASRREINMSASVRRTLPSLPAQYEPVTLLQLLSHTAGVRHYRDEPEAMMTTPCRTAAAALPRFVDDALEGVPGERESYSTWGFVLASAVLEEAAGLPFDALLRTRILDPAGMVSTSLEGKDDPARRLAYYDVDSTGKVEVAQPVDNSCKMGGGGFVASAEDLVRFHNMVLRGDLVPLPMVRQMLGSRAALSAGGSGPGGEAVSLVDLNSRISVVVLSNTSGLEQKMALERARGLLVAVFAADDQKGRESK